VHRSPGTARHSLSPPSLAATALRTQRAVPPPALPLPRPGEGGGDGVPDLRPGAVRGDAGRGRDPAARAVGRAEPRARDRVRPRPLDDRPAGGGGDGGRGGAAREGTGARGAAATAGRGRGGAAARGG